MQGYPWFAAIVTTSFSFFRCLTSRKVIQLWIKPSLANATDEPVR
jgi:hypothetical protein